MVMKIPGLYAIMTDRQAFIRMYFIFAAYESGLLQALAVPRTREELIRELDVERPEYYRTFGFEKDSGFVYEGVPQEVFFALSFDGHVPQGTVTSHEGFKAAGE